MMHVVTAVMVESGFNEATRNAGWFRAQLAREDELLLQFYFNLADTSAQATRFQSK
jgi:hypothetical protein